MAKKLRILIVEDVDTDYALLDNELRKASIAFVSKRVQTKESFLNELKDFIPDLIISDYALPHFDGMTALKLTQEISPTTPLIIVTGSMNEETAVECMKAGAADYVIKEHLVRVGPAIRRTLERKHEQQEKAKTEAQLKIVMSTIEQTANCVYITDKDGVLQYVNPGFEQTTGYSKTEAIGKTPRILKSGNHDVAFYKELWRTILAGKVFYAEFINKKKDGSLVYQEETITPILDGKGNITHFVASGRDVTERKKVEQERTQLIAILEATTDFVSLTDNNGYALYLGQGGRKMVGVGEGEEMSTVRIGDFLAEPSRTLFFKKAIPTAVRDGTWSGEAVFLSRDGREIPVSQLVIAHKAPDGTAAFFSTIAREIKEPTRWHPKPMRLFVAAAASVFVAEALIMLFLPTFLHFSPLVRMIIDSSLLTIIVLPILYLLSYKPMVSHIVEHERMQEELKRYNEYLDALVEERTIGLKTTNEQLSIEINERKRAEEKIQQQHAYFQQLFDNSPAGIALSDKDDYVISVNAAFTRMFQYSFDDVKAHSILNLIVPPDRMEEARSITSEALNGKVMIKESVRKRKDGTLIDVSLTVYPVVTSQRIVGVYRIFVDVSGRKKLEDQIRQVQKMESLGTLAGGIAHDFNNILGIILGHSALMERLKEDPQKLTESIETIVKATQRGAGLVKQLLTFARKQEALFESVSINDMIREINKLLQETFPKIVTISLSLQKDLSTIVADESQIHQVLLNLCVNARDAMPKGGTLSISTRTIEGEAISSLFPKATTRQYVQIEVADTGIGMDESTRQRIFEPFFTTKAPGKGTGLGLAVVFGIIENHNGFIDVLSAPGEGTSFTVYLPIPEHAPEVSQRARKGVEEIPGGTETILVIEDEEVLRNLAKVILVLKGYTVLIAEDGMQGVEMYQSHQEEIAVVLSDIGLPTLSGQDVFRRIREINPEAKVIMASGFIDPETKSEMYKAGLRHFIQKPYLHDEVLQKIREVIDTNG